MGAEIRCGHSCNSNRGGFRHASRVDDRIVMNNYYAVGGRMNIELDRVGAQLDCSRKRGYRVFRQRVVCATVGDFQRNASTAGGLDPAGLVQALLRRFALERRTYELSMPGSIGLNAAFPGPSTY
jgi:hypothetical protein